MAYGDSNWNANVEAKGYKYTKYDDAGFLHGSNISEASLAKLVKTYNNALTAVNAGATSGQEVSNAIADNNSLYQQYYQQSNDYNSAEAQKNRDWQEYMSNTAHQREVADLKAAGLNPVLSANGGAVTGSGATASSSQGQVDTSKAAALASMFATTMNSSTALKQANINADTQRYVAAINAQSAQRVAQTNASATLGASLNAANASMYGSDISKQNTQYSTDRGSLQSTIVKGINDISNGVETYGKQAGNAIYNYVKEKVAAYKAKQSK